MREVGEGEWQETYETGGPEISDQPVMQLSAGEDLGGTRMISDSMTEGAPPVKIDLKGSFEHKCGKNCEHDKENTIKKPNQMTGEWSIMRGGNRRKGMI